MTRPYRVVLAGCGGISRAWLEPLKRLPELELVGLVDLVEATAQARAAEFGFQVPTGSDLNAMLLETRPDLVFNCTVPEAHCSVTLAALAAGAHVFGEKPLADSLSEAEAMVRAARDAGKVFAVMQNRRYDPAIRALRDALQSGVIGRVTTVHADFFIAAHFGGFREAMKHVLIKDMAIHTFDAARFLTAAYPRTVYCHEWNPEGSWYGADASALAVFEMSDSVVFSYRGSWCSEGFHTPWESVWRIIGTKGTVIWDGAGVRCEVVGKREGFIYEHLPLTPPAPEPARAGSLHEAATASFVHALRQGQTPETHAEDNIHSLRMVLGAVESAETRKVVNLESRQL